MRPSSWKGVGAMAKVPAAVWVSFMGRPLCFVIPGRASFRREPKRAHPGMTGFVSKSPRRFLDLILREENLPGVIDDILRPPSLARRLPAVHFHHPHLAHAARAGDAEHFSGLIAGQAGDHV